MRVPQRREQTNYRKPNRLNGVSLTLALFAATVIYLGYSFWPLWLMRVRARNELEDVLPELYRINLRGDLQAKQDLPKLKKNLLERLVKVGIRTKIEIIIERSPKIVAVEAHFPVVCEFPFINKRASFTATPRAQTDATKVDW